MADLSARSFSAKHWQSLGFLFFSTLILFWPFLSPSGSLVLSQMGEDATGQFVWWRQFGFDQLRQGHLALWNPHLFCGEPFLGGFQSALFYPPNWLFMVLPLPLAINSSIALHVFLAGAFTYLWIWTRGGRKLTALMGAFMYMFGASYILHIIPGHLPNLCTMVWIPLIFLAIDLCHLKRDWRWMLLGMAALAMQVFSGHVQYVYYTAVTAGAYVLFLLFQVEEKGAFLLKLTGMVTGGVLLSAVQLLAGWDTQSESVRSGTVDFDFADMGNTNPERYWCLLMPDFFNGWKDYWGGGCYWEGDVFIGVTGFVLALTALFWCKDRQKWFFAGAAFFLMVLSVGGRTFLFRLCYAYFPLFSHFRGVGKFNIFITLFLIVLAAMALEQVFQDPQRLVKLKKVLWWVAGVLAVLAFVFWVIPLLGGEKLYKRYTPYVMGMTESILRCALTLGVLGFLAHRGATKKQWLYGFVVLAFVEVFFYAQANQPFFDLRNLQKVTQAINAVYEKDPGNYRVFTSSNNYTLGTAHSSAWGDDPFVPQRYQTFMDLTKTLTHYDKHFDHLLTGYPKALGLTRLQYSIYLQDGGYAAQKLDLPRYPRAFLVRSWEKKKLEDIWPQILSPKFNPLKKAWVEKDLTLSGHGQGSSSVQVTDRSTDAVEVEADTQGPSLLVLTDSYSSGWKAMDIQGNQNYEVIPVNGFMQGVPLASGHHHFLLQYRPQAFVIGAWISWVSWLLFLGCFFMTIPLSRRP